MKVTLPVEGPQHPTFPKEIVKAYEELFEIIPIASEKKDISSFLPVKGSGYDRSSYKTMIVCADTDSIEKSCSYLYERVVWTQLFPFPLCKSRDIGEMLKKRMADSCTTLLSELINFYNPTRIIFLTEGDPVLSDFAVAFTCPEELCAKSIL